MTVIRWERGDNPPSEDNLMLLTQIFKVSTLYLLGCTDDRNMIVAEEWNTSEEIREKADEERLLNRYRLLSPDMKNLVLAVVNNAILIDRDREGEHEQHGWFSSVFANKLILHRKQGIKTEKQLKTISC